MVFRPMTLAHILDKEALIEVDVNKVADNLNDRISYFSSMLDHAYDDKDAFFRAVNDPFQDVNCYYDLDRDIYFFEIVPADDSEVQSRIEQMLRIKK